MIEFAWPAAAQRGIRWAAGVALVASLGACSGDTSETVAPVTVAASQAPVAVAASQAPATAPRAATAKSQGSPSAVRTASPKPSAAAGFVAGEPLEVAPNPRRVRMPRLGIDAAMDPLSLGRGDELIPPDYGRAGWYLDGPEPGEAGRAVIAGHVDSKTGPDVFAALGRAKTGDRIAVDLADGSTVSFRVLDVEVHPRADFPTDRVYGSSEKAQLRLITCTGEYDRARGGYQDNVVVFADLVR